MARVSQFMEPGKGYRLKLKTGRNYNDLTYSRLGIEDFAVDHTQFESSMTLIATVGEIEGEMENERLLVGAFIDGKCRGYGYLEYVDFLNEYRVVFSFHGNASDVGKNLRFQIYDTQSGSTFLSTQEEEIFITDQILATCWSLLCS